MAKIYKYPLLLFVNIPQKVTLNKGYMIFDFQFQGNEPTIWAAVDPWSPTEELTLVLRFTGDDTDTEKEFYLGTATDAYGLVYHLFEIF